jgi:hypothetical protein
MKRFSEVTLQLSTIKYILTWQIIYGSICLSDIPKRFIKKAGKEGKLYLNISVVERKQAGIYGDKHFITCSCKKEEQIEGENL